VDNDAGKCIFQKHFIISFSLVVVVVVVVVVVLLLLSQIRTPFVQGNSINTAKIQNPSLKLLLLLEQKILLVNVCNPV